MKIGELITNSKPAGQIRLIDAFENGEDIRKIQVLLGHGSIRTTERYVKVSREHVGRTKSPLDILGTKRGKKRLR